MSSLLEQAIIDAKALKEAAVKNAEAMVIEKYSEQIKEAVGSLLEQPELDPFADDEDLGGALDAEPEADPSLEQVPLATQDDIPSVPGGDGEVLTFDMPEIVQALDNLDPTQPSPEAEESHEELGHDLSAAVEASPEAASEPLALEEGEEELDEEIDIDEAIIDELFERLKVDVNPVKRGWAGTPESQMRENEKMALARELDDEVAEENEIIRARVKELEEAKEILTVSNKKLIEENNKFKEAFVVLKEKVESVNTSNAKLLFINKTLENSSLNERQKKKIVEAISKSRSVEETKVIYETLQSAVGSTEKKPLPKSLSEAVNRSPSLIVNSRKRKEDDKIDIFSDRMRRLAGINVNKD